MPVVHSSSSRARRSENGFSSHDSSVEREQVERDVPRRRLLREHVDPRLGRVDPLLERAEVLAALGVVDHDLAVDHVPAGREGQLGEVAPERLAAPRLDHRRLFVDEHDRPEPVVLRLVGPLLADRQPGAGAGELGLDRRLQRQTGHGRDAMRCGPAGVAAAVRAGGPGPVRWIHGTRPRHRRRRGIPRDAVLAVRGGAADDRRQPRAGDAAVGADRARDARPARARRLHRPQRRADDRVHATPDASTPSNSSAATG